MTFAMPRGTLTILATLVTALGLIAISSGCATMAEDTKVSAERYQKVIANSIRTDQDRKMDPSRRPAEFLPFTQTLHRVDQAVVVAEATKAGFVLEAEGSFLRNPADPRDQSSGDAKIPTDKFALRFVKP